MASALEWQGIGLRCCVEICLAPLGNSLVQVRCTVLRWAMHSDAYLHRAWASVFFILALW